MQLRKLRNCPQHRRGATDPIRIRQRLRGMPVAQRCHGRVGQHFFGARGTGIGLAGNDQIRHQHHQTFQCQMPATRNAFFRRDIGKTRRIQNIMRKRIRAGGVIVGIMQRCARSGVPLGAQLLQTGAKHRNQRVGVVLLAQQ